MTINDDDREAEWRSPYFSQRHVADARPLRDVIRTARDLAVFFAAVCLAAACLKYLGTTP